VIVVHTVGGGHVDALVAAPLAAACALVVTRPQITSWRAFAITALLTLACLVKTVMLPVLLLWLVWLARPRVVRAGALHLLVVVALAAASAGAFFSTPHPFAPFASFGGLESWASPSHFVAQTLTSSIAGASAGHSVRIVVEAAFLALFAVLLWRLVRRTREGDALAPITEWGLAVFLLALSLPYLLPWYAAWFVPFLAFFDDRLLTLAGVFACIVLALTLVPADPFHGLTTPAVMDGVHYVAAPLLLLVLIVVAARLLPSMRGSGRWAVRVFAARPASGSRG
jgi:hypothetical protein